MQNTNDNLKNVRVLFNLLDKARKRMSESERASVQNDLQSGEYIVQHTHNLFATQTPKVATQALKMCTFMISPN